MTIASLEALEALPLGAIISDHGRLAARTPLGTWVHSDGRRWEPCIPVQLVGIPQQ
ncbi:hypothetical protein OG874_00710 [Nocardia sp. NBC_00565]|uniref:hypothetical protein n=1 Tax=Nocardia sp. NBC_00565 TaxID=2975993 RepID=UPI002E813F35|nr:hypothetical protein [Nocardia sp. NBC_00565]WUC03777.1 hypothetical protein OG874_00710 [Nocardia sp. NBC_00565]